jgi:hypothetical protein
MTVISQLAALSEAAPDMCEKKTYPIDQIFYKIGEYEFSCDDDIVAVYSRTIGMVVVRGQPALDWLQCALQRAIEAKGWNCTIQNYQNIDVWINQHCEKLIYRTFPLDTPLAEALLAALLVLWRKNEHYIKSCRIK